jgi:hyperosmotically inducible periplasmic protein
VPTAIHKQRAADLVASTVGVNTVVDELAIVKEVKVIQTKPAATVIETPKAVVIETKVIEKP